MVCSLKPWHVRISRIITAVATLAGHKSISDRVFENRWANGMAIFTGQFSTCAVLVMAYTTITCKSDMSGMGEYYRFILACYAIKGNYLGRFSFGI
jgi:hypothetical protein